MLERIELAFERQRRFTADAAHELRTPLALMRSQIDLALANRRTPEEQRQALVDLGSDVDRLGRLTGALLTLARGDAGGLTISRETADLAELLDLVAEQYAPLAAERDIRIDLDVEPLEIDADSDLLIQVLANLMDNALRHAPDGSVIQLGCRAEGDMARLWVSDEGPGIPAEHLSQIFERFYRIDSGRDRARGGAGLGLAISRMIVVAHGGTIGFERAEPGSTRVACLLPCGATRIAQHPARSGQ
jgi:signal transduction histidine kinase